MQFTIMGYLWNLINFRMFVFEGGGEGGAPAGGGEAAPAEGGAPGGEVNYAYPETFLPDYHGAASVTKFANDKGEFDFGQVMNSYVNLEKKLGASPIVAPKEGATSEEWTSTMRSLGLPENLDDYGVQNNLPENVQADSALLDTFKKGAHEAGILPHQAQQLLDSINTFQVGQMEGATTANVAKEAAAFDSLKGEWGDKYGEKVDAANTALKSFADEELMTGLEEAGVFKSPAALKFLDRVAEGMSESSVIKSNTFDPTQTVYDLEKERAEMYQAGSPFMTKNHPAHNTAIARYGTINEEIVKRRKQQQ